MARPLRISFPGAIYHAIARGNARLPIFLEDDDYRRWLLGLEAVVDKFQFEIFAFVCMPNHIHLFFRTPLPNLSAGMQHLLSGYANWFNARHRRCGHLFQGRFKGELIENETYFWNVSRYIHLNPVRGKRPLVARPEAWPWSSYPGYQRQTARVDWVAYDTVLRAWQGERGGPGLTAAAQAYRRFVMAGVKQPPTSPFVDAIDSWLLGGRQFVDRIRKMAQDPRYRDQVPQAKRLKGIPLEEVLRATADHFGVEASAFAERRGGLLARDVAAWLARRLTTVTLRELAPQFGLNHPDSVTNLTRRVEREMAKQPSLRRQVEDLRATLLQQSSTPE